MADRIQVGAITSEGQPQRGQKHRSSGNFKIEQIPGGFSNLYWEITGTQQPDDIRFNVNEDIVGIDPVMFENLTNGSVTDTSVTIRGMTSRLSGTKLYIADPRGSGGGSFVVTVYAVNK